MGADSVRLAELQAFVEAVDAESFTVGGKVLGRPQSTITKQVQGLEDWLGAPLLYPGTTTMTSVGERFIPVAREVVRLLSEAKETLAANRQPARAPVRPENIKI